MKSRAVPPLDLESTRRAILAKMRELRIARGWSQAELAERLGLSQARLSVIERGGGTISAEQLVALLALFNEPIEVFVPPQDPEDELQNALARLGALHLREVPGILPSSRLREVTDAVREVLVAPRSSRLILALAPVLVWNVDKANLDLLLHQLAELRLAHRLGWLADNIGVALEVEGPALPREWAALGRRAEVILRGLSARIRAAFPPAGEEAEGPVDPLDPEIQRMKTLAIVWENADPVARRWGIATELQPADFANALVEAARG